MDAQTLIHNQKILVISHTSFSTTDSMGSTLRTYFDSFEDKNIYQFFIKDMIPNTFVDAHYYRQTDNQAFKSVLWPFNSSFFGSEIKGDNHSAASTKKDESFGGKSLKKRYRNMLFRNIIWSLSFFLNKQLKKWIKDIKMDAIVLMPGDFSFLLKLATKLSKKYKVPLVIMQCESYFLKPMFFKNLSYKIYRHNFSKTYKRLMAQTSHCVYLCNELKNDYQKFFPNVKHTTLMKSVECAPSNVPFQNRKNSFIYAGNLGNLTGRDTLLLRLADVLEKENIELSIFTNTKSEQIEHLKKHKQVTVNGIISKEKLSEEYNKHKFILYLENFDEFYLNDMKYAFSTKITDILSSGCLGVAIGSTRVAGINYLHKNKACYLIDKQEDIESKIKELLSKTNEELEKYLNNAKVLLRENHNIVINSSKFKEIVLASAATN